MTKLLLLRHAESEWNAKGLWQGLADPPLSDLGRAEATMAAAKLEARFSRVVSSDLRRAAETADIAAETLGIASVERRAELREIDVGKWSGLTRREIDERWPGAVERWRRGENVNNDGEDRTAFGERIVAAVRDLAAEGAGTTLVVTHGGAVSAVERHLDAHPGVPLPRLAGRWFEFDGALRVSGDRVYLLDDHEPERP